MSRASFFVFVRSIFSAATIVMAVNSISAPAIVQAAEGDPIVWALTTDGTNFKQGSVAWVMAGFGEGQLPIKSYGFDVDGQTQSASPPPASGTWASSFRWDVPRGKARAAVLTFWAEDIAGVRTAVDVNINLIKK